MNPSFTRQFTKLFLTLVSPCEKWNKNTTQEVVATKWRKCTKALSTVPATNFSIKNNFWSMETVSGKGCEFDDGGGLYDLTCLEL